MVFTLIFFNLNNKLNKKLDTKIIIKTTSNNKLGLINTKDIK